METRIKDLVADVHLFNEVAGNYSNIGLGSLKEQAALVLEEAKELVEALEKKDSEETLKECVDCLVVLFGMIGKLTNLGYDVAGAWGVVNKNNLTKFPYTFKAVEDSIAHYEEQGIEVGYEYNNDGDLFVLKDSNGKVRKPVGYKKCSVVEFVGKPL